jgi:hypothetical protein
MLAERQHLREQRITSLRLAHARYVQFGMNARAARMQELLESQGAHV